MSDAVAHESLDAFNTATYSCREPARALFLHRIGNPTVSPW